MMQQLYAITDPGLMPGDLLAQKVEACLIGGCRYVQYRNKTGSIDDRFRDAGVLRKLCDQYGATLIINDDIDLAKQVAADGVHLGQEDKGLDAARRQLGAKAIIGITCHASIALAREAADGGANYVAFGRFFPSSTKATASPAELALLRDAKKTLAIPIVAIGGITLHNARQVIAAGADCLAVCHDIFAPDSLIEIENCAKSYSRLFHSESL